MNDRTIEMKYFGQKSKPKNGLRCCKYFCLTLLVLFTGFSVYCFLNQEKITNLLYNLEICAINYNCGGKANDSTTLSITTDDNAKFDDYFETSSTKKSSEYEVYDDDARNSASITDPTYIEVKTEASTTTTTTTPKDIYIDNPENEYGDNEEKNERPEKNDDLILVEMGSGSGKNINTLQDDDDY